MATPIKGIIDNFLKTKLVQYQHQEKITKFADKLLAGEIKKHVQIKGVSHNCLIFHSDSSAATFDFRLRKDKLLIAIQKEFPDIKSIHIKTGSV